MQSVHLSPPEKFTDTTAHSQESKTKSIDLSDRDLAQEAVHMMLRFLYTHQLDSRQKSDPLSTAIVADHFKVKILHAKALQELRGGLRNLIVGGSFVNFKKWALRILDEHADTEIERALVDGTASNFQTLVHNRVIPSTWNDIVQKHPAFANKVLLAMFPKPEGAGMGGIKRSAGTAFDDAYAI